MFVRSSPVEKQKYYQEICARRLGAGLEITCFAWDPSSPESSHIAVGTRDHAVQVLSLSSSSQLQSVFAGRLDNTVPKALCFVAHNLYVFGLYDGKVLKVSIKDGSVTSEHRCHSVIGSAAVYLKKGVFVIDNATDGFTLYHLNGADPIRTFVTDPPHIPVPKQVAFGEGSKVVIGGSSNGSVFVFDRRTGKPLATLQHTSRAPVQTIGVHDVGGRCLIACASPAVGQKKAVVSVWTHRYDLQKARPTNTEYQGPVGSFICFTYIMVGLLCILVGTHLHAAGELVQGVNYTIVSKWWGMFPTSMSPLVRRDEMGRDTHEKITPQGTHDYEIEQRILRKLVQQMAGVVEGGPREAGEVIVRRSNQPALQETGEVIHYAETSGLAEIIYL